MAQLSPLRTQRLQVVGMDCTSCKLKIEGRLERLKGVAEASVTVATGRLIVSYDSQQVSEAAIQDQVKSLGYGVKAERSPTLKLQPNLITTIALISIVMDQANLT